MATIHRVPIDGGPSAIIAADADATGIAVDASNVYWIDPYGAVKWVPVGAVGATPAALAADVGVYLGPVLGQDAVCPGGSCLLDRALMSGGGSGRRTRSGLE
jgi:hypothetical protein